MNLKSIISLVFISVIATSPAYSAVDTKRYCELKKKIKTGMEIQELFMLLGPPHVFKQPPNFRPSFNSPKRDQKTTEPFDPKTVQPMDFSDNPSKPPSADVKDDPLMNSFMRGGREDNEMLWNFEGKDVTFTVRMRSGKVKSVKTNLKCP